MKKILIDGSAELKDFDGNPIVLIGGDGRSIGAMLLADCISQVLGQDRNPQHDTLKCFDIGIELRRHKKVEVDESDFTLVQNVVNASDQIKVIKAQMIRLLKTAKEGSQQITEKDPK